MVQASLHDGARPVGSSPEPTPARPRFWVWPGLLLAPSVFLSQLSLNYALVPAACAAQSERVLSIAPALALVVTVIATLLAWRDVRIASRQRDASATTPDWFLAHCALVIGAFSSVAVALQWATQLVVHPCVQ